MQISVADIAQLVKGELIGDGGVTSQWFFRDQRSKKE